MRSAECMILLHITLIILLNSPFSRGRQFKDSNSIVKTIKVGDDEVIDCIDVHKQLALTHPLLLNHTIQMEPSMQANESNSQHDTMELKQSWHKYGQCPQGSIPISRNYNTSNYKQSRKYTPFGVVAPPHHQYATIQIEGQAESIHGAFAALNAWDPMVNPAGISISQLWISAGDQTNLNTMEAGWRVYPKDGDYEPRIFIYWTKDYYRSTGCYDLTCPGFVQTSKDIQLGASVTNLSVYGGKQTEILLSIKRDPMTGNWWLSLQGKRIGYWPSAIFTTLTKGADKVMWGGEVYASISQDNKTVTQMGNGHFPNEGYGRSSYVRDIKYVDSSDSPVSPDQESLTYITTSPSCYDGRLDHVSRQLFFFFGGPGCQPS